MSDEEINRAIMNRDGLPPKFPTHAHDAHFWEQLGRAIASFGFLEDVLRKAIFAYTGTRRYPPDEVEDKMDKWKSLLERAMTAQLWTLATEYEKAVKDHPDNSTENVEELVETIKEAAVVRNVLCHGSWMMPDGEGKSVPRFTRKDRATGDLNVFETKIDAEYLAQVQAHVTDLICSVIDTVTHMGWQFPGGAGPGKPVWTKE